MADIGGLAVGVISLGLQVTSGLSDYLNAVKGRAEELNSVQRQTTNMRDLLLAVQDLLPQVEKSWPESASLIQGHVQSCSTAINALHSILSGISQPASPSPGIRLKLATQKQKLTYPFNRTHLRHLEERLVKVNSALRTALQVTGLNVSLTTKNQLQDINIASIATQTQLQQLNDVSLATEKKVQQVLDASVATNNDLQKMSDNSVTSINELRQLGDDIRAMYQSIMVPQEISAIRRLSTARVEPRGGVSNRAEVSFDSVYAATSLASKPSLLSTSIEVVAKHNASLSLSNNRSSACLCRSSRRVSQSRTSYGYLSSSFEVMTANRHQRSCPLSRVKNETRTKTLTIEFTGLKRVLQTAFALSLVDSHGAGGRSISPSFSYYRTVDEHTSPAFRLIELVTHEIAYCSCSEEVIVRIFQCLFRNIFILYSKGKAHPKDIGPDGWSILHMISDLVRTLYFSSQRQEWNHESIPDSMFYTIYSGVINLITCGAPLNIYDRTGQTPCSWLMDSPWVDPCNELAKLCLPDVPLMTGNFKPLNLMKHLIWYSNFGEAAGCGPLSLAIVARDEERVQEILRLHPESLDEIDLYGNTSFHIAVHHPSCLRLILEAGGLSMLEKANEKAYVSDNITPLKVACSLGNKESVNILLTSGSRITSGALRVTDYTRIPDLLTILKQRRHELKQLALKNLTRTEAESIGLHKHTVLDVNAFKVQKLLQSRGLNVPLPLQVDDDMRCPSVYHLNFTHGRVGAFEMLWDLGFHAIDNLDEYHKSSIAEALYSFRDYSAARWLIEHGADYWTPLRAGYTPAHRFFDRLPLDSIGEINKPFELSELQKWLLEKFHQVRVGNACNCPCSISGCIPLSGLFRWDRLWGEPLRDRSWSYFKLFKAFRASLEEEDLLLFIRRMTFDALGLTHTCHCPVGWRDHNGYDRSTGMAMKYTFEEIEEINSEQGTLLDVFADLVNGFVQVAFEDHGGMPLIASDPDRFWIEHWLPRMEETLETLNDNKLTQEEISASEAIGVVWGPQPVQTIACGDEDVLVRYSPEWVMREMEKIMNE